MSRKKKNQYLTSLLAVTETASAWLVINSALDMF